MSKHKALGMGLGALLNEEDIENASLTENSVNYKKIEDIFPNPEQPRENFDEQALTELAESIKNQGIIQPILVEAQDNGKYMIIAGERRYRASKIAGLEEIPVLVRTFSIEEKMEIALIENIQREDLSPIEEAKAYKNILEHLSISQEELSKKVGKQRSTISNSLRLLKLPHDMQHAISKGDISSGHARALLSVLNPSDQKILFSRIVNDCLSVRETEKMSSEMNKGHRTSNEKEKTPRIKVPEIQAIEQQLIDILGTKVQLKGSSKKGKIEISYFSMDDLERIIEILH